MTLLAPTLIVFDTTALLASAPRDWRGFSRLGECYVPEVVLEQMEFMGDRASEPEAEATAREFNRFYPNSGWKKTNTLAEHPTLKPAPGHTLSKRARLSLEVLGCAYGLALRYPSSLVVLVANDQAMLQKVLGLHVKNLCGLPVTALQQWYRTQRRPQVVNHHLQLMRSAPAASTSPASARSLTTANRGSAPVEVASFPVAHQAQRRRRGGRSLWIGLLSNLVSLVVLAIAVAAIWSVVRPASFKQFWQQLPVVGNPRK